MTTTVTGTFDKMSKLTNAYDELVAKGIPREHLLITEQSCELKVKTPDTGVAEITEILRRHEPQSLH